MPKSDPDLELKRAAQLAIRKHRSIVEAASAIGLSPATLWRVAKSGRAIPRTRATLEAWRAERGINETNAMPSMTELSMSREELLHTRRVLITMLQFLDRCIDTSLDVAAPTQRIMK